MIKTKIPPVTIDKKFYEQFVAVNERDNVKSASVIRDFVEWYTKNKTGKMKVHSFIKEYGFKSKTIKSTQLDEIIYQ